jgi:hypothetical protein
VTLVAVSSVLYGNSFAVAVEATADRVVAAMVYLPPIGTQLLLRFVHVSDDEWPLATIVTLHARAGGYRASPRGVDARLVELDIDHEATRLDHEATRLVEQMGIQWDRLQ